METPNTYDVITAAIQVFQATNFAGADTYVNIANQEALSIAMVNLRLLAANFGIVPPKKETE